jgi:hypothetical protein
VAKQQPTFLHISCRIHKGTVERLNKLLPNCLLVGMQSLSISRKCEITGEDKLKKTRLEADHDKSFNATNMEWHLKSQKQPSVLQ